MQAYWLFRDEIAIIDRIAIKGRIIIIPASLKDKVIKQLNINHMDIEKTRMLVQESKCCSKMTAKTEEAIKSCPTCLDFQAA